jgi:siroheme decarboxylase
VSSLRSRLLDLIQEDLPIDPRPYLRLAESLGVTEAEVLAELADLRDEGILRDLSPVLNPKALGSVTTLCCLSVPPERVEEVALLLNAYEEVTHNYEREHEMNLWFTLVAPSRARIDEILAEVADRTGLGPIHDLPARKVYKLRAVFGHESRDGGDAP